MLRGPSSPDIVPKKLPALLVPLRLLVGWPLDLRRHGFMAVFGMVLLRLVVGWHFFHEGWDKYQDPNFDAKGFLTIARGPLAPIYHDAVWDYNGAIRLDVAATRACWESNVAAAASKFNFSEEQNKRAQDALGLLIKGVEDRVKSSQSDIDEFRGGLKRLAEIRTDTARQQVESLQGQSATVEKDIRKKIGPTLSSIDKAWSAMEFKLNQGLSQEQQAVGPYKLSRPRTGTFLDTSVISRLIPWFDMIVGLSLMLGCLAPLGGIAAGLFLLSVFMSQFPPEPGPGSTYYNLVESMACFALAGFGAGRYAGLDFFFHALLRKCAR
jgi:uncharacterized membrane protein YphA (DoxX/SURF4 family)